VVFERLFRPKRKFLVRLAKRGNSTALGVIEGSNANEVYEKVIEMLQSREDVKEWPIIRIMNTETGVEVKFPNPFAPEESFESRAGRGRGGGSLIEELADEVLKENIVGAFKFFTELNANTVKTLAQAYGEALKSIVSSISPPPATSNPQPQQYVNIPYVQGGGSNLRDIAELVKAVVMLYQVWSANPKAFDSFIQSRIRRFLEVGGVMASGGETVESSRTPGESQG